MAKGGLTACAQTIEFPPPPIVVTGKFFTKPATMHGHLYTSFYFDLFTEVQLDLQLYRILQYYTITSTRKPIIIVSSEHFLKDNS